MLADVLSMMIPLVPPGSERDAATALIEPWLVHTTLPSVVVAPDAVFHTGCVEPEVPAVVTF